MLKIQVVPDGWARHHRPTVEGFMVDTLRIERRGSQEVYDEYGTLQRGTLTIVYEGPGVVELPGQRMPEQRRIDDAGIVVALYVGRIPNRKTDVQEADIITVLASPDPGMIGQRFYVKSVEAQDFAVDRQMILERVHPEDKAWPTST